MSNERLDDLPRLISVPEAAKILGITRATGYRLAKTGELPTARLGGRIYVVTERLRQFIRDLGAA